VETIGSKRSYALIWCMPNNDDDDDSNQNWHNKNTNSVLVFLASPFSGVTPG